MGASLPRLVLLVAQLEPLWAQDCLVQAPAGGDLGDCPQALASGSSCRPSCREGYESGAASCSQGLLSLPACTPLGCNVSEALRPQQGLGSCPELLASGEACEPACGGSSKPSGNASCLLGNLSQVECVCPAGYEANRAADAEQCLPCPLDSFKSVDGPGPCESCPENSNTNATARTSRQQCQCPAVFYPERNALDELVSCRPCPNHSSAVAGSQVCQCWDGYVRVPKSEDESLVRCRLAEPCNVSDLLLNLTGPVDYKLKMGSCEVYADSLMPSGKTCSLLCDSGLAAQLGSDIFRAIDLSLGCQDGILDRRPPEGYLWCSEASWEVPPMVFLGMTTAATILGATAMEVRQHDFERQYARALRGC